MQIISWIPVSFVLLTDIMELNWMEMKFIMNKLSQYLKRSERDNLTSTKDSKQVDGFPKFYDRIQDMTYEHGPSYCA